MYYYLILIILLIRLHSVKLFKVLFCVTNNSTRQQTFAYSQLNRQTILFLAIQFNISHLFTHSLNVKQFYLTQRWDPIWCYQCGSVWKWEK